jgi:kinesin family protein 1/kinesin family protein 3/17
MQGGDGDQAGIIPRMNQQLFLKVEEEKSKHETILFLITVSYFEIYNEVLFDLLDSGDRKKKNATAKGGLEIKEHPVLGVYVKGLQEIVVDSTSKLQLIIDQGMKNRTVASTQMNADSSRSHSVFIINLHQKDIEDETKSIFAKINLVDLAGSERVKSTGATGSILKEGANINKSLSALGNVINALVEASKGGKNASTFIPYRNSKLTRVLQESLGGNSITAMLAAMSPAASNFEETLSTLKYANRAKAIKVKAIKNEQSNQISKLNDEIRALKEKLNNAAMNNQQNSNNHNNSSADLRVDNYELEEKNRQRLLELEEAMKSTWEAKSKMSEEYERDRQQMMIDQQNAARQLEAARLRNWILLEQKDDLEITLNHVKTLFNERMILSKAAILIHQWMDSLRDVTSLERSLIEHDTVMHVYRSSLEKDSQLLVKVTL